MSHFTMLVAGADPDYELAPFHEFECTGHNDEFVQNIDETEEYRKDFEKHKAEYAEICAKHDAGEMTDAEFKKETQYKLKGQTFEEFLEDYERFEIAENEKDVADVDDLHYEGNFKYGYALRKGNDDFQVVRRTNPNKKWDWYQEGGRWDGLLLMKEKLEDGSDWFTNSALKSEIDFEEMWRRSKEEILERYRKVIAAFGHVPVVEHKWSDLVDEYWEKKTITREEAEKIYDSQPDVQLFRELAKEEELKDVIRLFDKPENYACTEEEYLESKSIYALTFGFVKDRQWNEKAEMGWWGCTSNEKEPHSWNETFKAFLDSLPDDTLLTVVDCHI